MVPRAGHFVFLDQPALFHEALGMALQPYLPKVEMPAEAIRVGDIEVDLEGIAADRGAEGGWQESKGTDVEPLG